MFLTLITSVTVNAPVDEARTANPESPITS